MANVLLMHSGKMDVVARTRGRSFFIMLHETEEVDGIRFCKRVRSGILYIVRNTGVSLNVRVTYQMIEGNMTTFDNVLLNMESRMFLPDLVEDALRIFSV